MSDLHSLAGEYAVGSLSDEEFQQFEAHLETCPDCREEVAEMRDVAVQLSEAVATEPPLRLRDSVLEQIAHTAQDRPAVRNGPVAVAPAGELGARRHVADGAGANVVPLQRSSQRRTRLAGLLAAAAVVAAVAMGGWAVHSRNDARDAAAQAQSALTQTQRLTQVLTAQDVKTASGSFSTGGTATVVVSHSQGRALLVAAHLPALPRGKVYEAWTVRHSPTRAGTFSAGAAQTVLSLPAAAVTANQVAVTVEPAGGSKKPTTVPVFAVRLPRA